MLFLQLKALFESKLLREVLGWTSNSIFLKRDHMIFEKESTFVEKKLENLMNFRVL